MILRLALLLALALVLPTPASAQVGIFQRSDCTTLTSPVVGKTYCFDQTANTLKVWTGTAWISDGGGSNLVKLTPSTLSADQADYNPAGGAVSHFWRLSASVPVRIKGIVGCVDDAWRVMANVGSVEITFGNQDAGATAGNRIITGFGADAILAPDGVLTVVCDSTSARWRVK